MAETLTFEARDTRKSVNERLREHLADQDKAVSELVKATEAALQNEQLTRKRVEVLESVLGRGFVGRARWFFFGR